MVGFSWNRWLALFGRVALSKNSRRPRRASLPRIEGLEDRALLTAHLPQAVNDVYNMDANTSLNGASVLINDVDEDGDDITQALLNQTTQNGSLSLAIDGTFTYTPTNGFVGTDSFSYTARDAANGENSAAPALVVIHVGTGNQAPTANDANFTTNANTRLNGIVTGSDPNSDPLTFVGGSTTTSHGFVTLFSDGHFTYDPDNGFVGQDTFTFVANDGQVNSAEATITIDVGNTSNTAPVATSMSRSIAVDEVLNDQLAATDANNDALTFALGGTSPAHGTVAINTDGSFTYTPDAGFNGSDSFTFVANDGTTDSNEATVSITIGSTGGGHAPVAISAFFETPVNTPLSDILNATDEDNDALTYSLGNTSPLHGTVSINPNGTFTYTPDTDFTGHDSFSYVANDGTSDSNQGLISIDVGDTGGTNATPVVSSQSLNTNINTDLAGTLTATDADNDPLTFAAGGTLPQHGTVAISTNGTFTYTPNTDFTGTDSFTFVANDGTTNSAEATITITVGNTTGNTAPAAASQSLTTNINTILNGTLVAVDADNDPLTFAVGGTLPEHGTVTVGANGSFSYTPFTGYTGPDSFTFVANDGTVDSAEATISITVGSSGNNTAPTATAATFNTSVNTPVSGTLTGFDADGDSLTFHRVGLPSHGTVTVSSTGAFTFTPTTGFVGTDTFTFAANDGTTDSAVATITVNVGSTENSAPIATPASLTTGINTILNGTLTGTDADGDTLVFSATTVPTHGTLTLTSTGSFSYTPNTDFTGLDTFSFRVNDGTVNSTSALVTIDVGGTGTGNTAPVASSQSISTTAGVAFSGNLSATDADNDSLTFEAGSTTPLHGTVSILANGAFTYTPAAGFNGIDSFSFKVNDGTVDSAEAFVTVNVGSVSTTPVANPTSISTAVGVAFSGTLSGSDPNNDPLTFSAGLVDPTHGTVSISPNGSFLYTPSAGFEGTDFFSFKVNNGTENSADALVTVHIGTTVNTPPMAFPQTVNVDLNTQLTGQLNALDVDGDPLEFFAGSVAPLHGTVSIDSTGSFVYTPNNGYTGDDLFSFNVSDGTASSVEALVTLHVGTGSNTAPTVSAGSADINENEDLMSSLAPLGFDPQGDTLTFSIVSQPGHGTVSLSADGNFVYTPNNGFHGTDSFVFKANDGTQDSNAATFTINVGETSPGGSFDLDLSANPGTIATSKRTVTPLDPTASLVNVSSNVDFSNTAMTVRITQGGDRRDKLVVTDLDGGTINVRGKKIFFNNSEVARLSGGKRGDPLQIAFDSSANLDAVNAVLKHIGIRTLKSAPAGTRTIEIKVNADGVVSTSTIDANLA